MGDGKVVTVLGPRAANSLGVTDAHDHLFLRTPALPGQDFDDLERAVTELDEARGTGLQTIVEMTPIGCGRRPDLLRALSDRTGVSIIGSTGYHRDAHYPSGHWVYEASIETLASRLVTDIQVGMHPSDWLGVGQELDQARAGVIKAGASYQRISPFENRRLVAAALASLQTGAAILVHTEVGTCAAEVLDLLEQEGIASERVILAHVDRNPDLELHCELAARGVNLEFDTLGRIKYRPDSDLLDLIQALVAAGHGDRLMLGLDLGRRDYFRAYEGGPGLRYLLATFVPRLKRRIGGDEVEKILVSNPARAFTIRGL